MAAALAKARAGMFAENKDPGLRKAAHRDGLHQHDKRTKCSAAEMSENDAAIIIQRNVLKRNRARMAARMGDRKAGGDRLPESRAEAEAAALAPFQRMAGQIMALADAHANDGLLTLKELRSFTKNHSVFDEFWLFMMAPAANKVDAKVKPSSAGGDGGGGRPPPRRRPPRGGGGVFFLFF